MLVPLTGSWFIFSRDYPVSSADSLASLISLGHATVSSANNPFPYEQFVIYIAMCPWLKFLWFYWDSRLLFPCWCYRWFGVLFKASDHSSDFQASVSIVSFCSFCLLFIEIILPQLTSPLCCTNGSCIGVEGSDSMAHRVSNPLSQPLFEMSRIVPLSLFQSLFKALFIETICDCLSVGYVGIFILQVFTTITPLLVLIFLSFCCGYNYFTFQLYGLAFIFSPVWLCWLRVLGPLFYIRYGTRGILELWIRVFNLNMEKYVAQNDNFL